MSLSNNRAYYNMEFDERKKENQNVYNPYYNNQNNKKNFKKETLLQKTKNSVSDLIKFNDDFKNSAQYPGEQIDEIKIKQYLLPVYDKIYEIKEDLNKFSKLNNNQNLSNTQFNEMQSLHTNMVFNKNLIDDTMNYMKEKIENVPYEQIHKEFEEITSMLEALNFEMENMVSDFNNKYEKIIKEKKRQKIAEDLANGNYNKSSIDSKKYDLLNKNDDIKIHKIIDNEEDVDYNKYKYDIDQLNSEKENLMLKYLEDKQKAINGLPKLVAPNEKVSFKYDIKPPDYNNDNNINNQNIINKNSNSINNNNINNNIINNNNSINNNNNINSNSNINNSNDNKIGESYNFNNNKINESNGKINKKKSNKIPNNYNGVNNRPNGSSKKVNKNKKYVNYMEDDDNNNNPKRPVDLTDTMNDFQKKMNMMSNQILTGVPKKNNTRPKIVNSGPTKADYMRNIQPRSNASQVTYQNFKRKKPEPHIIDNKFNIKPNRFKVGKYPNEEEEQKLNDFIEQHPQRPIKNEQNFPIFDQNLLDKQIQKLVELNVKKALEGINQNNQNNSNNNSDLLNVLIQKFDDIEDAIRETKNQNGMQVQEDINEMLANEIFNKIYSQINNNINININDQRNEQPVQPKPQENIEINKEDKEIPQNINIFDDNNKIGAEELDKMIPAPRNLNANMYDEDYSDTSSVLCESIRNKNNMPQQMNNNINITKVNISDNRLFYENNVNNNNNISNNIVDNSISKGEVRSESEEESLFENNNNNNQNLYKTDNNFYNKNKNKTGYDLLMLKYYNENLPDNYYYNNINNMDDINNINNINNNINNFESNKNINYNNNRPEINMNNNKLLKEYNLYGSDEYNSFKNKFQEKMNNYKTDNDFGLNNPNYNSTYTQMRPIQNSQNLNNTMGYLKIAKINNKEVNEIDQKIKLLKEKNKQLTQNFVQNEDINTDLYEDKINNNINNRKSNDNDDDGEYSEGEVRSSKDSY